jgi:SAM-dependent methyltransferase
VEVDPRWYEGFFGADWLTVAPVHAERTTQEVDFVVEQLGLTTGSAVLDLACGHGRHAIELARRGCRVTGLDLSEPSLELARGRAAETGVDVEWVHADMREVDASERFDAVINLFSAFGYFEDERDDARVLAGVARALRPGGCFLLDTVNPPALFARFRPRDWRELEDGTVFTEEREYNLRRGRTLAAWRFVRPNGESGELRHSLRLYTYPELERLLGGAALRIDGDWGGFDGSELTRETWRMIVRAHRDAAA